MRRRNLLAAVTVGLLVAGAAFVLWPRPSRITRVNFEWVRVGTSRAKAEVLLGPPGDYTTGPVVPNGYPTVWWGPSDERAGKPQEWRSDNATITVSYDRHTGQISAFTPMTRLPQSPFDNLLWRAKRLWRKWFP
jgi:hypothetical protein